MSYKPKEAFVTPIELLNPTCETVKGVAVKRYPETGEIIFGSFKTYGGTENSTNDQYSVIDTANIETWYRPDITSESRIRLHNKSYDVIGEPEDILQRHQYLKFKVRAVTGGA